MSEFKEKCGDVLTGCLVEATTGSSIGKASGTKGVSVTSIIVVAK